jgi:hypothetical protein
MLRLHRAVLAFRAELEPESEGAVTAVALDADTIGLRRTTGDGGRAMVVVRLRGAGDVDLVTAGLAPPDLQWTCLLTSEDPAYSALSVRPDVEDGPGAPRIRFHGPAAVILVSASPPAKAYAGRPVAGGPAT